MYHRITNIEVDSVYDYEAFISYRHIEPDSIIAEKLHKYIEKFHIPRAIKIKTGRRKIQHIFRDREELPTSDDLGKDIEHALERSKWLILICSPDYLKSKWCMKELEYFISMGRSKRILTVLVRGEPQDSFPSQIRYREENGTTVEVEPLAADLRCKGAKPLTKATVRSEFMRILAPILGVNYDELRRRDWESRQRRIIAVSTGALLGVSLFTLYALTQNRMLEEQRNLAQRNANEAEAQRIIAEEKNKALTARPLSPEELNASGLNVFNET